MRRPIGAPQHASAALPGNRWGGSSGGAGTVGWPFLQRSLEPRPLGFLFLFPLLHLLAGQAEEHVGQLGALGLPRTEEADGSGQLSFRGITFTARLGIRSSRASPGRTVMPIPFSTRPMAIWFS